MTTNTTTNPSNASDLEAERNEQSLGIVETGRRTMRISVLDRYGGHGRIIRLRLIGEDGRSHARIDLSAAAVAESFPLLRAALDIVERAL